MARRTLSSIDRLPPELRELIGKLRREDGFTVSQIHAKLMELNAEVSRSAVGRHIKSMAVVGERMRHSRELATALVAQFGDEPDNRLARVNLEMMHGVVMTTIMAQAEAGEDGEGAPITFSPQDANFLASALKSLAAAEKTNAERTIAARREALKEAAGAVKQAAGEKGLSAETADFIMSKVLGVAA